MATVSFSVPDEVEQVFNETFAGQNRSALIADLMLEAVERARSKERSLGAYTRIVKRRANAPIVTEAQIRAAREAGCP